jgi:hypothetical protein
LPERGTYAALLELNWNIETGGILRRLPVFGFIAYDRLLLRVVTWHIYLARRNETTERKSQNEGELLGTKMAIKLQQRQQQSLLFRERSPNGKAFTMVIGS